MATGAVIRRHRIDAADFVADARRQQLLPALAHAASTGSLAQRLPARRNARPLRFCSACIALGARGVRPWRFARLPAGHAPIRFMRRRRLFCGRRCNGIAMRHERPRHAMVTPTISNITTVRQWPDRPFLPGLPRGLSSNAVRWSSATRSGGLEMPSSSVQKE